MKKVRKPEVLTRLNSFVDEHVKKLKDSLSDRNSRSGSSEDKDKKEYGGKVDNNRNDKEEKRENSEPSIRILMSSTTIRGKMSGKYGTISPHEFALVKKQFSIANSCHHLPESLSRPSTSTVARYDQWGGSPEATGSERLRDTYRNPSIWARPSVNILSSMAAKDIMAKEMQRRVNRHSLVAGAGTKAFHSTRIESATMTTISAVKSGVAPMSSSKGVAGMPRAMKLGKRILMISQVSSGPFDCVGFSLYDPVDSRGWGVTLCPKSIQWPFFDISEAVACHSKAITTASIHSARTGGTFVGLGVDDDPVSGAAPGLTTITEDGNDSNLHTNNVDKVKTQDREEEEEEEEEERLARKFKEKQKAARDALILELKSYQKPDHLISHIARRVVWRASCTAVNKVILMRVIDSLNMQVLRQEKAVTKAMDGLNKVEEELESLPLWRSMLINMKIRIWLG